MKLLTTMILAAAAFCAIPASHASQPATRVIAHRGYWKAEGAAQNSIRALQNAIRIGAYGSEFDVLVTADGVPVIHHDDRIGERRIEDTPYRELRSHRLSNGEKLPTLRQYLKTGAGQRDTRLILEMKAHSTPEKERQAARIILDEVRRSPAAPSVDYITFSKVMADEIVRLDPAARVYYLNGDLSPAAVKAAGYAGLDYHHGIMRQHETWFNEAHALGLEVNVWTVNDEPTMRWLIDHGADYITTDEPELLQSLLNVPE
ncbi:MAG: glycerophosphodiester phosphodiesterase [Rikenellaceae bacterium]|nr:glycerophosphodiester phosphodiesterase [Rikenellaceae bacterium]